MKNVLTLTEYQLRCIRKPLFALLLLMGPIEFATMLFLLHNSCFTGSTFYTFPPMMVFFRKITFMIPLFLLAAVLLNASISMRSDGRSQFIRSLMTLPVKRSALFISSVISGLLCVWSAIAAQAVWFILMYKPFNWFSDSFTTDMMRSWYPDLSVQATTSFLHNGLFLNMMRSAPMQILFSRNIYGFMILLLCILAVVVSIQAITCHTGFCRILQIALTCATLWHVLGVMWMHYDSLNATWLVYPYRLPLYLVLLIVFTLISGGWAIHSLRNAKNL